MSIDASRGEYGKLHQAAAYRFAQQRPWKCRGMESMESHAADFPFFPHPLEIPAGIRTLLRLRL
jgi:hypothetical protein